MDGHISVYCGLMEDKEEHTGWDKETISYCIKNRTKMLAYIKTVAHSKQVKLDKHDVDDIYEDTIDYLYRAEDYNIDRAYNNDKGAIVPIEGYLKSIIKFMVLKGINNRHINGINVVTAYVTTSDNKEMNILDNCEDERSNFDIDSMAHDLEYLCRMYEAERYTLLGIDIFQLWLVKLETIRYDKQEKFIDIMKILGAEKTDIEELGVSQNKEMMTQMAMSITQAGIENAIQILTNYVYGASRIEQSVMCA